MLVALKQLFWFLKKSPNGGFDTFEKVDNVLLPLQNMQNSVSSLYISIFVRKAMPQEIGFSEMETWKRRGFVSEQCDKELNGELVVSKRLLPNNLVRKIDTKNVSENDAVLRRQNNSATFRLSRGPALSCSDLK